MLHFKPIDLSPRLLPVDLHAQVLPGTFEHALCQLIDHEFDLSELEARFDNDAHGALAYAPAVLLKIVLPAYSRGIVSSRAMQRACRDNVLFIAVSGDEQPDHRTLAAFVSGLGEAGAKLFAQVLVVCDRQGLIGREIFAIDGVKLPSNASKAKSGTREEFAAEAAKMEEAVQKMIVRSRALDAAGLAGQAAEAEGEARRIERLKKPRRSAPGSVSTRRIGAVPAGAAQIQPHRQRLGQDGQRQRRHSGLHRGRHAKRDCQACGRRTQCLRTLETTPTRQVCFFRGRRAGHDTHTDRMKKRIDTPAGRSMIGRRFATVEPVFGDLRHNKGLNPRVSIASACAGAPRSMGSGSSTAWCTTCAVSNRGAPMNHHAPAAWEGRSNFRSNELSKEPHAPDIRCHSAGKILPPKTLNSTASLDPDLHVLRTSE